MNTTKKLKIAVIGGDGTGPEVAAEGLKVLAAVAKLEKFQYELVDFDFGGERYLEDRRGAAGRSCDELRKFDAIYLGAVGHPKVALASWKRDCCSNCGFNSINTSTCGR